VTRKIMEFNTGKQANPMELPSNTSDGSQPVPASRC
jgi:hypothetical protein